MPAKSEAQRRFFGAVRSLKEGKSKPGEVGKAVRKAAKSVSMEQAREFTSKPKKRRGEKLRRAME